MEARPLNTHTCLLAIHSLGFLCSFVCVCGNNLSGNASPNDPDRAVNYTLIRFSPLPPLFCKIKEKRYSFLLELWWDSACDPLTFWGPDLLDQDAVALSPLCSMQPRNKCALSVWCLEVTASVNGNYPPIHPHVHWYTVNTHSIPVFTAEHCINLWAIIVKPIVTMQGGIYSNQKNDRVWKHS